MKNIISNNIFIAKYFITLYQPHTQNRCKHVPYDNKVNIFSIAIWIINTNILGLLSAQVDFGGHKYDNKYLYDFFLF